MIVSRMTDEEGNTCLMIILEPGNIAKMCSGQPIIKDLREFIPDLTEKLQLLLTYTPDAMWVAEQMALGEQSSDRLADVIGESYGRNVVLRTNTEELEKLHPAIQNMIQMRTKVVPIDRSQMCQKDAACLEAKDHPGRCNFGE